MEAAKLVMTGEQWAASVATNSRPPTSDDVSITLDGRRLDTKEKVLAFLAEIEVERSSGMTTEDTLIDDSDVTE
jgi:hypothetical protein